MGTADMLIERNFEYERTAQGGYLLKKCKNKDLTEIEIPATVTELAACCFERCENLTFVSFCGTLPCIPARCFAECTALEEIELPEGVTEIGPYAFEGCIELTDIEIPNGVGIVDDSAFCGCSSLDTLTVPPSVHRFCANAFEGCKELTDVNISDLKAWCNIYLENEMASPLYCGAELYLNGESIVDLVIPDGVIQLHPFAFANCTLLESVHLPASLGLLSPLAFYRCAMIERFSVDAGNSRYRAVNGTAVLREDNELVLACEEMESLPACTKSIAGGAFSACSDMTELSIGADISLCDGAFYGLDSLKRLTFSPQHRDTRDLTCFQPAYRWGYLMQNAFELDELEIVGVECLHARALNCFGEIKRLKLPSTLTEIARSALCDADIGQCNIPKGLKKIALQGVCLNNMRVTVDPGSVFAMRQGCLVDTSREALVATFGNTAIPRGIRIIQEGAFSGNSSLTSIRIGDTVTDVLDYAFSGCENLRSVTFSPSIQRISGSAFRGSTNLQEICFEEKSAWRAEGCNSLSDNAVTHFWPGMRQDMAFRFLGPTSIKWKMLYKQKG